jgi:hypothetical protein
MSSLQKPNLNFRIRQLWHVYFVLDSSSPLNNSNDITTSPISTRYFLFLVRYFPRVFDLGIEKLQGRKLEGNRPGESQDCAAKERAKDRRPDTEVSRSSFRAKSDAQSTRSTRTFIQLRWCLRKRSTECTWSTQASKPATSPPQSRRRRG